MHYKEMIEAISLIAGLIISFGAIAYIAENKEEGWGNALAIVWVPMIFIVIALIALSTRG